MPAARASGGMARAGTSPSSPSEERFWPNSACFALQVVGFQRPALLKPQMQCHSNLQFLDSRPRACSHRSLFVRQTPTRPRARGQKPYFTQRLVRSVRCGSRVRQRTLLNLGRHVALPCGDGPTLCARVERILAPQRSLESGPAIPRLRTRPSAAPPSWCRPASPPWARRPRPTAPTTRRPPCRGSTSTPWSCSARARSASSTSPCGPCGSSVRRPCSSSWACPVRRAPRPRQPRQPHGRASLRARRVALAAPAQRPGRAARLRLRDHGPERPAARQRPPAAPPRHDRDASPPAPRTTRSTCRPTTGAATRRRWPGSGSRWRAAGRPIPGSTACAPAASAGTPSGCGTPA